MVIAILPIAEVYDSEKKRENHLQAEEVACESIHILDGYKFKGFSPKIHLRDNCHTTKEGGKLYASNFLNYLKLFSEKKNIFNGGPKTCQYSFYVPLSERPLVDLWEFNSGNYIKAKKMKIKYEIEPNNPYLELIMELHIGPGSPVLDLKYGGEIKDKFSVEVEVNQITTEDWEKWNSEEIQPIKPYEVDDSNKVFKSMLPEEKLEDIESKETINQEDQETKYASLQNSDKKPKSILQEVISNELTNDLITNKRINLISLI